MTDCRGRVPGKTAVWVGKIAWREMCPASAAEEVPLAGHCKARSAPYQRYVSRAITVFAVYGA